MSAPTHVVAFTPGPFVASEISVYADANRGRVAACHVYCGCSKEQAEQNARLLAATASSYTRHCGERAIECAEGDLLGEALAACKIVMSAFQDTRCECHYEPEGTDCQFCLERDAAIKFARAILAKAGKGAA